MACPIWPKPKMPAVLPRRLEAGAIASRRSQPPSRTKRSSDTICRALASSKASATSATSSVSTFGVVVMAMPRSRAWSSATPSRPTPLTAMISRCGSKAMSVAFKPSAPVVTTARMAGERWASQAWRSSAGTCQAWWQVYCCSSCALTAAEGLGARMRSSGGMGVRVGVGKICRRNLAYLRPCGGWHRLLAPLKPCPPRGL